MSSRHGIQPEDGNPVAPWVASEFRLTPIQSKGPTYPATGHHLGRGPKHYRRSTTGRMLAHYPELDFRPEDNSGVRADEVPAGTKDIGVFRCVDCGGRFEAMIANRVRQHRDGESANRCSQCSGWTPTSGNSLADLPLWLRSQLRVPLGVDLSMIPIRGGTARQFPWQCPAGHEFYERVGNRLQAHAKKCHHTEKTHSCGCAACSNLRPTDECNFATRHPELAARLDRMTFKNGYSAVDVAPQGGKRKHWFWCGDETHAPYYSRAKDAWNARGLGCHGCAARQHGSSEPVGRPRRSTKAYGTAYKKARAALLTDNPPCHWCGAPADTADHLVPVSIRQSLDLVPACRACNFRRHTRLGPPPQLGTEASTRAH
jgi:hypothetical protein